MSIISSEAIVINLFGDASECFNIFLENIWKIIRSANSFVDKNAKQWAGMVQDLMREHSPDNNCLAMDVSDPVGIQMLLKQFNVKLVNAQKYIELARSIKSDDELICMRA